MKKLFSVLLALALMLTGASLAEEERMTVTVMGIDWGYSPMSDNEMERCWEDLFDLNMEIEWVNYADYPQKVNTLIASNTQPDVIQIMASNSQLYYPIFTQAIDAGNFVDLKPYLENGIIENNSVMCNWPQAIWDQCTYNGGIYILPRDRNAIATNSGIEVRRDLMIKYGFEDEPTTMDELKDWLIDLSNAATEGEGEKIYALDFCATTNHDTFMQAKVKAFAVAFTGQMDWGVDEDGEYVYMQFNPKYMDFLDWMKDLYDAGVLDPEFALGNTNTSKWKGGHSVAFLSTWYNWNQSEDRVSNKIFDSDTDDSLECWCLMPVDGPEYKSICANTYDFGQCIAISSACSEEKILKILDAFNKTEETLPGWYDYYTYGVEGIHYERDENGNVITSFTEEQSKKRTEGYVGGWYQILLNQDQDIVASKFDRPVPRGASQEAMDWAHAIEKEITEYMAENPLQNATTNLISETYKAEWDTLIADLDDMCIEYVMGTKTREEFEAYVEGIVSGDTYKTIQAEFKEAAGE